MEGGGEDARDIERPQVLVLDIDQLLRTAERLGVGQRDAPFSVRGVGCCFFGSWLDGM